MKELHIHIDRLVVDGLPRSQQRQFVRALEAQLETQLPQLASQAFASGRSSQRIARVSAGPMRTGTTPERAAIQVASALRGAISGKGNPRA
jgi:hypothetical protein